MVGLKGPRLNAWMGLSWVLVQGVVRGAGARAAGTAAKCSTADLVVRVHHAALGPGDVEVEAGALPRADLVLEARAVGVEVGGVPARGAGVQAGDIRVLAFKCRPRLPLSISTPCGAVTRHRGRGGWNGLIFLRCCCH